MLEIFILYSVDNVVSIHANSFKWKENMCHNQTQESNYLKYHMVSICSICKVFQTFSIYGIKATFNMEIRIRPFLYLLPNHSFNCTFCANCFWIKMLIGQHSWSGPRNYGNEIWKSISWSIWVLLDSNATLKTSMPSQVWFQQTCHPNFSTSVVPPSALDFLKI